MNDLCAATIGFGFLWLFMMSVSETKYRKPWSYIILGILAAAFCYVTFCNTIFDEYGSVAPQVASGILGFWAGTFALRLFFRGFRSYWTTVWFALIITLYVGAIVFNAISEYFFWNEFGVRYNFIAVDYLVYTNEVVGNIMESYPVLPMSLGIIVVTLLITWYLFRRDLGQADRLIGWRWKAVAGPAYIAAMLLAVWLLHFNTRFQDSDNVYVNELQANGLYKFYDAFVKNELDYEQFYITEPEAKAEEFVHGVYGSTGDNLHAVRSEGPEIRRNIVLITIESMSASFMGHFGNTRQLTPVLDSLYDRSLAFDRVYATGNRTVRGLEAVTLSLPPCPGQSIIKRPNNAGMHSTGALLRDKGYTVKYFYGGNSYFDNMETFFSGNGYEIVDQRQYEPGEITFANIWGVCDEDAYRKVIRTLNEDAGDGKPFFAHVMTVSNHRPFTYPAGKVSIPHDAKSRNGGVMYTDYALGRFFAEASKQPWFANTIFLITADHCASSAGRTEIPLEKYHIPALIYAPGFVEPQHVGGIVSQIDLMPTLLSLLNMSYDSHFYGRSIYDEGYVNRAFIATYQDLGYLEGDVFTILSPVRRFEQYRVVPTEDNPHNLEPMETETPNRSRAPSAITRLRARGTNAECRYLKKGCLRFVRQPFFVCGSRIRSPVCAGYERLSGHRLVPGRAVSLHHHVPVGVERQLVGRIIARAVGKLGIDGRQVNDRTGYGDFVVAELAVTARTHHIVTRSGIRAGTGGLRIVGEPGRAVEKRVGIRTGQHAHRRPGSPLVDILPPGGIHVVGDGIGEIIGKGVLVAPQRRAEAAFDPFETHQAPQVVVRQHSPVVVARNDQRIGLQHRLLFARKDVLVLHDLALDIVVRIARIVGGRTDADHAAVVPQHEPFEIDVDDLPDGMEQVVARIELELDGRLGGLVVEVYRLVDIAEAVGRNNLARGEQRLVDRPRRHGTVVHTRILGPKARLQLPDGNVFQSLRLEIGAGVDPGRPRIQVIAVTACEKQGCGSRQ